MEFRTPRLIPVALAAGAFLVCAAAAQAHPHPAPVGDDFGGLGAALHLDAAPSAPLESAGRPEAGTALALAPDVHPRTRCLPAGFTQQFDGAIRAAWLKHIGARLAHRHCGWRGQVMMESSGRPGAVSSAGAAGLAQIMPAAALDCRGAGLVGERVNPRFSLACGAWLMERARKFWSAPRDEECLVELMRGSYISGAGHLLRAQRLAGADGRTARCWRDGIGEYLPRAIAPANAGAAAHYLERVAALERDMTPPGPAA